MVEVCKSIEKIEHSTCRYRYCSNLVVQSNPSITATLYSGNHSISENCTAPVKSNCYHNMSILTRVALHTCRRYDHAQAPRRMYAAIVTQPQAKMSSHRFVQDRLDIIKKKTNMIVDRSQCAPHTSSLTCTIDFDRRTRCCCCCCFCFDVQSVRVQPMMMTMPMIRLWLLLARR